MMDAAEENPGLGFKALAPEEFLDFARRHRSSPEIGPIATCFDDNQGHAPPARFQLLGLTGCGRLCAVACCTLSRADPQGPYGAKLDSVIVDGGLRRRGLATLLVAKSFHQLLSSAEAAISVLYAHAVHPATVRLLARLSFSDPPPTGAPLAALQVGAQAGDELARRLETGVQDRVARLKLQCALCRTDDRRTRPWCGANDVRVRASAAARPCPPPGLGRARRVQGAGASIAAEIGG